MNCSYSFSFREPLNHFPKVETNYKSGFLFNSNFNIDFCLKFLIMFCALECMSQVFVTDLWSEHTPWSFNQLPKSYNFLVKHGPLWKMTYYGTAPRLVHQSNFAATSTFIAR